MLMDFGIVCFVGDDFSGMVSVVEFEEVCVKVDFGKMMKGVIVGILVYMVFE